MPHTTAPAPGAALPAAPPTAAVSASSAAPPVVEQATHTLVTLLKKSKGRSAANTLDRTSNALVALAAACAADTSTALPGVLLQDLVGCMRTTDSGALQTVLQAAAVLSRGVSKPNPRRLQLASAPGFLTRAVACLSSANDDTATAAAEALATLSAFEPEACALILQQGGAMQALLTLMDGRRSGASPHTSGNALNCLANLGAFGGEAPLRQLAAQPVFVDAVCARIVGTWDAGAYTAARALHEMAFLPADPAAAAAATGYHPVPTLMSASLAPRHWRALGARLSELLRAAAEPLLSDGGPAAARPDPECLHVVLRLAWDGVVAESARAPLLKPWSKTVEALDAVVAAGAARPRGVLLEVLIAEPDAVLCLARLASSGSPVVDPTGELRFAAADLLITLLGDAADLRGGPVSRLAASDDDVLPLLRRCLDPVAALASLRFVPGVLAMYAGDMSPAAMEQFALTVARGLGGRRAEWVEAAAWALHVLTDMGPCEVAPFAAVQEELLNAIARALTSASETAAAAGGGGGDGGAAGAAAGAEAGEGAWGASRRGGGGDGGSDSVRNCGGGGAAGGGSSAGPPSIADIGDGGEAAAACGRRTAVHLTASLLCISGVVSLGAAGPVGPMRGPHIARLRSLVTATRLLSHGAGCHSWLGAAYAVQALASPKLLPALVAYANAPAGGSSPSPLQLWCELTRDAPGILRRSSAMLAEHAQSRQRRWELLGGGDGGGVGDEGDEAGAACQRLSKEEEARTAAAAPEAVAAAVVAAVAAHAAHAVCRCVLAVLARVLILQLPGSGRHAVWPLATEDGGEGEEDGGGGGGSGSGADGAMLAGAAAPGPGAWDDLWAAVAAVGGCGELKSLALLALAVVEARRCIANAGAAPSGDAAGARLLLDQLWGIMQEEAALVAAAPYPDVRTASEKAAERGARLAAARDAVRCLVQARKAAVRQEIADMSRALPLQSRQTQQRRETRQLQQQLQQVQEETQQAQQEEQLQLLQQPLQQVQPQQQQAQQEMQQAQQEVQPAQQQMQEAQQHVQQVQQQLHGWSARIKGMDRAYKDDDEEEDEEQLEEAEGEGAEAALCSRTDEEEECERWARLFAASPALIGALLPRRPFTCSACVGKDLPAGPPGACLDPAMNGRLTAMVRTPGATSPGGGLACWLAAAADEIEVAHADFEALGAGQRHVYFEPVVPPGWLSAAGMAGAQPGQGEAAEAEASMPAGRQRRRCAFCGAMAADGAQLRRCAGCGPVTGVRYCSQACCRNHWVRAGHRQRCEEAQRQLRAQEGLQEPAVGGLT